MKPKVDKSTFVDKTAVIIGDVEIGKNCGIFPHAVIRGDQNKIRIGNGSNVQDCCVIHVDKDHDTILSDNVSIGHGAVIHGAHIDEYCLIGMHATVLNGAKIGRGSVIGAGALVKQDMVVPENSLVVGIPGKVVKTDEKLVEMIRSNVETYKRISKDHLGGKHSIY